VTDNEEIGIQAWLSAYHHTYSSCKLGFMFSHNINRKLKGWSLTRPNLLTKVSAWNNLSFYTSKMTEGR